MDGFVANIDNSDTNHTHLLVNVSYNRINYEKLVILN